MAKFFITNSAATRILEITESDAKVPILRVGVDGGGCSGFQYNFIIDAKIESDDNVFESGNVKVVIDTISMELLDNCTLDYTEDLGSASFIIVNPKTTAKCGCGNSFAI